MESDFTNGWGLLVSAFVIIILGAVVWNFVTYLSSRNHDVAKILYVALHGRAPEKH